MKNSVQIHEIGQSFWLDNIDRQTLINGELKKMIMDGVIWGVTSNPSIFQKAITTSNVYRSHIQAMSWAGLDAKEIYERLVIRDIRSVADLLLPVYEITNKKDGYVSIEVDPELADKGPETAAEAERLWKLADRPNVMIKIPATDAGIFAIRETIAKGINVNVTLIFSVETYARVIDAYIAGLEERISKRQPISNIHSVASFFISRMDAKVDKLLEALGEKHDAKINQVAELMGRAGIDNALLAYEEFISSITTERFKSLTKKGANTQRPLWASTSTKNPKYSDIIYVQDLILPQTVNTIPDATLAAFLDHGIPQTIDFENLLEKSKAHVKGLESMGIDIYRITEDLKTEGVQAFSNSQSRLLSDIEELRAGFVKEIRPLLGLVKARTGNFIKESFSKRLCSHDVSLWPADEAGKAEIAIRLDWLEAPVTSRKIIESALNFKGELEHDGFTHAVVLGMGGSSLAPEVFGKLTESLGAPCGLKLSILDSTCPEQVIAVRKNIPLDKTTFFVSSKSGTTSEMDAGFRYFWEELEKAGQTAPERHFVAISDPGTILEKLAKEKGFRGIFSANPNVGGRYSALIEFGLLPAVVAGVDVNTLLGSAEDMMISCNDSDDQVLNPGILLGIIMAEANSGGRDKLTIIADSALEPIGAWIEQLIAESSGKDGKGILPVAGEPMVKPEKYGSDRLFVYLRSTGDKSEFASELSSFGHPVIEFLIDSVDQLGGEFYRWEVATAVACSIIGVNAFDQPNVQLSKTITKAMINEFKEKNTINEDGLIFSNDKLKIYTQVPEIKDHSEPDLILKEFLGLVDKQGFIAINAFVARDGKNYKTLQALRKRMLETTGLTTTMGFGPRFLHSTGQLHKGGKNNGLFIVITDEPEVDFEIPGEEMTFGALLKAQAIGDIRALQKQNRRVLHLDFKENFLEEEYLSMLVSG